MDYLLRHPLPGELLTSFIARTYETYGIRSWREFLRSLFGDSHVVCVAGLPAHLDALAASCPAGSTLTAHCLLDDHTLFPYYSPFLPEERRSRLAEAMRSRRGYSVHSIVGVLASQVAMVDRLRLCPECIIEDRHRFDAAYWHRVHQVPGVLICHQHQRPLAETAVSMKRRLSRHVHVSAMKAIEMGGMVDINVPKAHFEECLKLAQDSANLLEAPRDWQLAHYRLNLRTQLWHKGLALRNGRLQLDAVQKSFAGRFPSNFLRLIGCQPFTTVGESWLLRLLRGTDRIHHPLLHLLVSHWLGGSIRGFFSPAAPANPFGLAPFPCLNPAADHYRKEIVAEHSISEEGHITKAPRGVFRCLCGFEYARIGPDKTADDRYRYDHVEAYGFVWYAKLRDLWMDCAISLRMMARQLGVDPLTIKRKAAFLQLPFPRRGPRLTTMAGVANPRSPARLDDSGPAVRRKREELTQLIEKYPGHTITQLRRIRPDVYTFLYRHDREWLMELPRHARQRSGTLRINDVQWAARDQGLSGRVAACACSLRMLNGKPRRVTMSALARMLGCAALVFKHSSRLPMTMEAISQHAESREQFAIRRIELASNALLAEGVKPKQWLVIKRSGVERLLSNPRVVEAIKRALGL